MFPTRESIDRTIVWHVTMCALPAMFLLRLGAFSAAAYVYFGLYGLMFSYSLAIGDARKLTAVTLGCLPGIMLLRDFFYYSSVEVILAVAVGSWMIFERSEFDRLFDDGLVKALVWFAAIYWVLSYLLTGDYSANLRIFELVFSAVGVRLLARRRAYLATALWSVGITGFAIGIALIGQGERLGMVRNSEIRLGNPITFGIPMALILVLILAEHGRWLLLEGKPIMRAVAGFGTGVFLLLSTSRGSWAVVTACVLAMLLVSRHRRHILQAMVVGAIPLALWMYYSDSSVVTKYVDKTFSSKEEWSVEYNARVAQWNTFPTAFADSPIWGFGPGRGKQVSITYSGHSLIWHSLYLHLGIECGLLGLIPLMGLLGTLVGRGFKHRRLRGEVAPLLGVIGFAVVATSVPAIDGVSGLFLGLSLAAGEVVGTHLIRAVVVYEPIEPELVTAP
ncbi:MAG: O-antigen ligase family protein [Candidatus Solibacter sp.]